MILVTIDMGTFTGHPADQGKTNTVAVDEVHMRRDGVTIDGGPFIMNLLPYDVVRCIRLRDITYNFERNKE